MTVQEWLGKDNTLGIDIWEKKYRYNNESFDEWLDRVSGGNEQLKKLILEKKFLFGGRILANRGLHKDGKKITYSNCYVIEPPEDNIESIFNCASKLARTFSYGGGCGIDISKLAPKGAKVNNAAKETSGSVSFMDLYSLVTQLIGQNGRRGALMISISCDHPDLEEFIELKSDLNKVTKANLSIRITNEFMNAVKNNSTYNLKFIRKETNETIEKKVNAREIFHKFALMNWDYAEPAFLYWDNITDWNLLSTNSKFEYAGVNPCAEEPLPAGGSCLLGSINLSEFVENEFTDKAEFNLGLFKEAVKISVDALNEILDEGLNLHPLQEQRNSVSQWRQIGLGIMGIADMLIKMGIKYGSPESISLCDEIGGAMIASAIKESNKLASKYSKFSECNPNEIMSSDFYKYNRKYMRDDIDASISMYGLRNSQLLTTAPTGSISTMLGISGGIEPIFSNYYERKTESLHGKEVYYKVYTPIVKQYMEKHNITDDKLLPDYFITSQEIPYKERIDMQSVWQTHIDASISSTVNLPNTATVEDVENLYLYAWEKQLKGITVYRDGCKRGAVLSTTTDTKDKTLEKPTEFPRGVIEKVPSDLAYRKFKIKSGCGNLYLFIGIDEYDGKIYDVFTNTDGVGGCTVNTQAVSRLISACLRGGVPIEYVIEQLSKSGTCPSYQYKRGKGEKLSDGKSCASSIATIFKKVIKENKELYFDDDEEAINKPVEKVPVTKTIHNIKTSATCPECGSKLRFEGGCQICVGDETHVGCGYSKCE
jgi:ribonucleoside-diphosphate reductase alpha chain